MTPEQATQKYKWVKYDPDSKTIELFLDHHMLSSLRHCEASFFLEHILQCRPAYGTGRKPWFLDFGEYIHAVFELYYVNMKKAQSKNKVLSDIFPIGDYMNQARQLWDVMRMDEYSKTGSFPDDKYDEIGGWPGVSSLLMQYYDYYENLRMRIIDTEIVFGFGREVCLGEFSIINPWEENNGAPLLHVKCYLIGRIDLLTDNGNKIGPIDHKHTHKFRGDEWTKFNPQDAITGYILAVRSLIKLNYPKYFTTGKECLSSWVFHISACTPSVPRDKTKAPGPRFKVTPIDKTLSQLEDFKARQLSTFKRVCDLLFNNKSPEWNTLACHNTFNRNCQFLPIHEVPSEEWNQIIRSHFTIGEQWSPLGRFSSSSKTETQEKENGKEEQSVQTEIE